MTPEAIRVLQAVAWSERMSPSSSLPLKRIATATLGGDDELATRVLASLDEEGCVHTDTKGQRGSLTGKGRSRAAVLAPPL